MQLKSHRAWGVLLGAMVAACGSNGGPVTGVVDAALSCDVGTACNGSCVDTATDPTHCGACGNRCGAGMACVAGACAASCPTGQIVCNGVCATLATDRQNCGACGTACAAGQVCTAGVCATSCSAGLTDCSGTCVATMNDPTHCGSCTTACALSNASAQACAAGTCVVGACAAGFGDCDRNAANGCEVTLRGTDVTNCGGCGTRCAFANAAATCVDGACVRGTCTTGFGDCDGNAANGCEASVTADNANCGACGTACAAGQVCSAGACTTSCGAGLTACGGSCVATATDTNHCGGCGRACGLANVGVPTCVAGVCAVGACAAGFGDCDGMAGNGCETNVRAADAGNCGGCGVRCAFPNATATCAAGTCAMGACLPGYSDCDGMAANGCEVSTGTDATHCGTCTTVCGGGQVCSAGACTTTCGAGLSNCSGSCTNVTFDPSHCGACGTVCNGTNGTPFCARSTCGIVCSTGFGNCDGSLANGCETPTTTSASHCGGCGIACAAGRSCVAGVCVAPSTPVTINFDNLANLTVLGTQYAGVVFSSASGQENIAYSFVGGGSTAPNILCTRSTSGSVNCAQPTILTFTTPVSNIQFRGVGIDNAAGSIVAVANVYAGSTLLGTRNVLAPGGSNQGVTVDLTGISGVTRLEIVNITDGGGIGWDNFTYLQ